MRAATPKRRSKPPAPAVSTTVAKLISQIQAEAEAATLAALSAKDGILVLQPLDPATARTTCDGIDLTHIDDAGNSVHAFRRTEQPAAWRDAPHMQGTWHPAHWNVSVERFDGNGQKWIAYMGRHVIDDFGQLVKVPR